MAPGTVFRGEDVRHAVSLGLTLFATWLLLSGHYTPFITGLGAASCVAVVVIVMWMDVCDHETHPVHLTTRIVGYWLWLLKEIAKANIDVAKRVLAPRMAISPALIRVKPSQVTDLGQVLYANSITLTPGTTTIDIDQGTFIVHTIAREVGADLAGGDMDRRVTRTEGLQ